MSLNAICENKFLSTSVNDRVIWRGFYFHETKSLMKISEFKVTAAYVSS